MVERLSECTRVSEFNEFLAGMKVDRYSSGRKFVFVNEKGAQSSYTMNQLVARLEICVKGSIGNDVFVDNAVRTLTNLSENGNRYVGDGCSFKIRQALGNFFYWITHFGFDKAEVLKNIADHSIKGRQDLTVNIINHSNDKGIMPLTAVLMQDKPFLELAVDVKEMLANEADPRNNSSNGENSYHFVVREAEKGNTKPLEALLFALTKEQFRAFIYPLNIRNLKKETRLLLAEILHKRFETCEPILDALGTDVTVFLSDYKEYLESNPQLLIYNSDNPNVKSIDCYLTSEDDKQFFQSRYEVL